MRKRFFIMEPEPSLLVFTIQICTIPIYILWGMLCLWVHKRWKLAFESTRKTKSPSYTQGGSIFLRLFLAYGMVGAYAMAMIVAPLVILWTIVMAFAYNFWGWNL